MNRRTRVLFVCSGNSCRSQMAEGWARHLKSDAVEAYSAGISIHGLNRIAVRVMAEAGVDISNYRAKKLQELRNIEFDYVVTVCSNADAQCPSFPGSVKVVHVPFDDPPALARMAPDEDAAIDCYRRVRDEIRAFVEGIPERLETPAEPGRNNDDSCASSNGADTGRSRGDPVAAVRIAKGETVVVLGASVGRDAFTAGCETGARGHVIGIDAAPSVIAKARAGLDAYREQAGLDNVEFRLGEIEHLPLNDDSADTVVSNCAMNASTDKQQVWREIARVLRPGGRVSVSDIALLTDGGGAAGALLAAETERMIRTAGLVDVALELNEVGLDSMTGSPNPALLEIIDRLPEGAQPGDLVAELYVTARKPRP